MQHTQVPKVLQNPKGHKETLTSWGATKATNQRLEKRLVIKKYNWWLSEVGAVLPLEIIDVFRTNSKPIMSFHSKKSLYQRPRTERNLSYARPVRTGVPSLWFSLRAPNNGSQSHHRDYEIHSHLWESRTRFQHKHSRPLNCTNPFTGSVLSHHQRCGSHSHNTDRGICCHHCRLFSSLPFTNFHGINLLMEVMTSKRLWANECRTPPNRIWCPRTWIWTASPEGIAWANCLAAGKVGILIYCYLLLLLETEFRKDRLSFSLFQGHDWSLITLFSRIAANVLWRM